GHSAWVSKRPSASVRYVPSRPPQTHRHSSSTAASATGCPASLFTRPRSRKALVSESTSLIGPFCFATSKGTAPLVTALAVRARKAVKSLDPRLLKVKRPAPSLYIASLPKGDPKGGGACAVTTRTPGTGRPSESCTTPATGTAGWRATSAKVKEVPGATVGVSLNSSGGT